MTDKQKIALGICVSPYTTDHCPYCTDICDAFAKNKGLNNLLEGTQVQPPKEEEEK